MSNKSGTPLREWLFKTKISITKFSILLGVDRSYLHKILKGDRLPSENIMKRICEVTSGEVNNFQLLKDRR